MSDMNLSLDTEQSVGEQYLTFLLAGEEYAIEILRVQEIKENTPVARMPNTHPHVLGVTNLRGAIIPILDLRRKFGLAAAEGVQPPVVIIVRATEKIVGVIVDAVTDVLDIPADSVQEVPGLVSAIDGSVVSGIAHIDSRLISLLDFDRILGADLNVAA